VIRICGEIVPVVQRAVSMWTPFSLFTVAAIVVLQQPMGMRHGPEPTEADAAVNAPPALRGTPPSPAHHHHSDRRGSGESGSVGYLSMVGCGDPGAAPRMRAARPCAG
jgi:hypothetical protein